jgi:hypothetical protein
MVFAHQRTARVAAVAGGFATHLADALQAGSLESRWNQQDPKPPRFQVVTDPEQERQSRLMEPH